MSVRSECGDLGVVVVSGVSINLQNVCETWNLGNQGNLGKGDLFKQKVRDPMCFAFSSKGGM